MTAPTAPVALASAVWTQWAGDPDSGRWLVESGDGLHLGVIEAGRTQIAEVEQDLRDRLTSADLHTVAITTEPGIVRVHAVPEDAPRGFPGIVAITARPVERTRVAMYATVVDLIRAGLPAPSVVNVSVDYDFSSYHLDLRLPEGCSAEVDAWAEALGLTPRWGKPHSLGAIDPRWYRWRQAGDLSSRSPWVGWTAAVGATVDLKVDSSGLEGTGWAETCWIAAERKGITAHRPTEDGLTVCGRSTSATGATHPARHAFNTWGATFECPRCWIGGSPITTGGGS